MNNMNATGPACVVTELKAPGMSVEEVGVETNVVAKESSSCHISKALSNIPVVGFVSGSGMMPDGQFLISVVTILIVSLFFCSLFVCIPLKG